MIICPPESCTGCSVCVNVCPRRCVALREDELGALHPVVDEVRCVSCGRCAESCPVNRPVPLSTPSACFAVWRTDVERRCKSASGGVGAAIAEHVIRDKHGVVFGTAYDSNLVPVTTAAERMDDLEAFKGSKYVQSVVSEDLYRQMRELVDAGRFVAYIATPCQIAAAKRLIGRDVPNFLTVDLICHGVAPTRYFTDLIRGLRRKHRFHSLSDVRFRGNDGGNFALSLWEGGRLLERTPWDCSPYFAGYLLGVTLRENCYACRYARPDRVADLTIGDFIGLRMKERPSLVVDNVSSVTTNTAKGASFYADLLAATPALVSDARDYAERLRYRPSLMEPSARHPLIDVFRARYVKYGTVRALARTLGPFVWRHRMTYGLCQLAELPRNVARKLYRALCRHRPLSVVVVTWRASENYGTSLQAFALEWKLRQLGYRVRILSSVRTEFTGKDRLKGALKAIGVLSALVRFKQLMRPTCRTAITLRQRKLLDWARRVHRSADVTYPSELKWLLRTTDCFISGSDQIWNSYYAFDPTMYLAFAGGRRRVAYASSVGTRQVNPAYAGEVRELLNRFAAIGVRESETVEMMNRFLGRRDVVQVVDPTLLLTAEEWNGLTARHDGGYLLVYLIGARPDYAKQVRAVRARSGLSRVVVVPSVENSGFRLEDSEITAAADPFEFVSLIRNAALVCTDSFHATAFAVNLSVPFVEFLRFEEGDGRSQNSRIHDLLGRYGLEGQLYDRGVWRTTVDFSDAQRRLVSDRAESLAYLKRSVDGTEREGGCL